jgi:CBS domain-containing protein
METVAEIMDAQPATVGPTTDVESVVKAMRENELPGLPVVDSENNCVGIITENDLILRDEEADLHIPHYVEIMGGIVWLEPLRHFEEKFRKALASTAQEMMTPAKDLTTVTPETAIKEAGRLIAKEGHNRIPVVDADGKLQGVVTRVDVLGALSSQ